MLKKVMDERGASFWPVCGQVTSERRMVKRLTIGCGGILWSIWLIYLCIRGQRGRVRRASRVTLTWWSWWNSLAFLVYFPTLPTYRDMAMRRIFWGFCRNWFLIDPLHYPSSRSDFGFEFGEIFVIEKRLRLPDLASHRLSESVSQRLSDLVSQRVGESGTLRLGELGSRWLVDSQSRGVHDLSTRRVGKFAFECLKENSVSRRVGDSPTRRVRESSRFLITNISANSKLKLERLEM